MRNVHAIVDRHSLPWDHEFIQCELENSMEAITNDMPYSADVCAPLMPKEMRNIDAIEGDLMDMNDDTATIHFSPPNEQYAKEAYYPPMKRVQNV